MKVLHVISDTNVGGAGVLLTTLLRNFDRDSIESTVALPRDSALRERIRALGIPTVSLHHPIDRLSAASLREIGACIHKLRPDIIHANAALCARVAGKLCNKKVVHTRHCCFPPQGVWRVGAIRQLGGLWNRMLSDRVIATAEAAAEDLLRLGIPRNKIEVIINGSEEVRQISASERRSFLERWDLTDKDFTVGICARLVPCKGHDTFLYAAKLAIGQLPTVPFRFLIVGEGEMRARLEKEADLLGIGNAVRFLGFVEDMAPVYRCMRVNVNCSTGTETSCLALSEGMSAGVPMVVSDYGGNRAMLGDGKAGFLCAPRQPQEYADAICRIAASLTLEESLRRAAWERYLHYYTAKGMTDRVTALYEKLLTANG